MSEPTVSYTSRPDGKPHQERNVLAAVYKLCLERSHARKRGRLLDNSGPDDGERNLSDTARRIIQEPK